MIIGIDASQANTQIRTGTEWYSFHILSEWIKQNKFEGHSVLLYTRDPLLKDFPELPQNWKVKVLHWPLKIFWTQIRLSFEMCMHSIDLLFVPSHAIPLILPKKVITTIHDIGFESTQHVYGNRSVVRIKSVFIQKIIHYLIKIFTLGKYGGNELDYHRFSVRYALKHATQIFTVSEFTKKEIESRFSNTPTIFVAYNGINHDQFYYPYNNTECNNVLKSYHLNKPYILSLGRVEKKKNSLELLKAFHLFSEKSDSSYTLVFAGSDGLGAEQVKEYVQQNGLTLKVLFLDWVSQHSIAPLMASSSLFAFFSEYEGFGVPLIQALAVGTPVLANDLPVFHEIAEDAVIYCNAHNTKQSASAIADILNKRIDLTKKKERGIELAHRFRWDSSATQMAQQIDNLLAKSN